MSYASFRRLPYVKSFKDLQARLQNTAPLRKVKGSRDYTIYPLHERAKGRQFSFRLVGDADSKPTGTWYAQAPTAKEGDIEIILYSCPVITFHKPEPDPADPTKTIEEVTLFMGEYPRWSMADAVFIKETLGTFVEEAHTDKGRMVLDLYQGDKVVIPRKGHVRLRIQRADPASTHNRNKRNDILVPVQEERTQLMTLRINRKKANEVRARYGEFYRYVRGMVNVRKEMTERHYYDYSNSEEVVDVNHIVKVTGDELSSVIPTETTPPPTTFARKYADNPAHIKPPKNIQRYRYNEKLKVHERYVTDADYKLWLANVEEFLTNVRDGADHEAMYKGFVWLAFYAQLRTSRFLINVDPMNVIAAEDFAKTLDEIVFKYHSEEVFERVPAKPNTVPSTKYEAWVTRETNDGV